MAFAKAKLVLIEQIVLVKKLSILEYITSRILEKRGKTDTGLKLLTNMQFSFL